MAFVPEGQHDSSQALRAWQEPLKGLQIEWVNNTRQTYNNLSPLQGESPYLMVLMFETPGLISSAYSGQ
jgi:hypothetical protein